MMAAVGRIVSGVGKQPIGKSKIEKESLWGEKSGWRSFVRRSLLDVNDARKKKKKRGFMEI
jgi:hypothetical protein